MPCMHEYLKSNNDADAFAEDASSSPSLSFVSDDLDRMLLTTYCARDALTRSPGLFVGEQCSIWSCRTTNAFFSAVPNRLPKTFYKGAATALKFIDDVYVNLMENEDQTHGIPQWSLHNLDNMLNSAFNIQESVEKKSRASRVSAVVLQHKMEAHEKIIFNRYISFSYKFPSVDPDPLSLVRIRSEKRIACGRERCYYVGYLVVLQVFLWNTMAQYCTVDEDLKNNFRALIGTAFFRRMGFIDQRFSLTLAVMSDVLVRDRIKTNIPLHMKVDPVSFCLCAACGNYQTKDTKPKRRTRRLRCSGKRRAISAENN